MLYDLLPLTYTTPNAGFYEIVVGAEDDVGAADQRPRCEVRAGFHLSTSRHQLIQIESGGQTFVVKYHTIVVVFAVGVLGLFSRSIERLKRTREYLISM